MLNVLSHDQGFHFCMPDGHYTGETATSLSAFAKDLKNVNLQSVRYHFDRGDFQKWIRTMIGDEKLAQRIDKVDKKSPDEKLRKRLSEIVEKRIAKLQTKAENEQS